MPRGPAPEAPGRPPPAPGRVSPARLCAHRVVRRVFGEGAFADRAFRAEAEAAGLDPRERALAQQLAYGTIQRRATLDACLAVLAGRPATALDPPLLDALRLGVFQVVYLAGVADHAAVDQTVELAKLSSRGHGLANAVMRRATREAGDFVAALGDGTPAEAAVRHSHPEWIVRLWWDALGAEEARALLDADNHPAESAVRANELATTRDDLRTALAGLGVPSRADDSLPEALVLDAPFDAHGSRLFREGALMPQSRASMLVTRILAPEAGESVLDLCAAPGAKTTHAAALMGGRGRVAAVERHSGRARALAANCRRMRAAFVEVVHGDAVDAAPGALFDRVLLDAPCSDLGTLQSRPDIRWRKTPLQVERLAREQDRLLAGAARRVSRGGTLVYSTCTISPLENEAVVERFLDDRPDFTVDPLGALLPKLRHAADERFLRVLPHRHGTDGFFVARLRREG